MGWVGLVALRDVDEEIPILVAKRFSWQCRSDVHGGAA